MRITIKLHPGSSRHEIKKITSDKYEIWLKEKAIDNKANTALIKLLKKHLKKDIKIIKGLKSKNKIIEAK